MIDVNQFERFVLLEQQATPPEHYDDAYFNAQWRANGNDYRLETRREIEGKHPQLIVDTFHPERVLDVGCGPGALVFFLHELGVDVRGVDYSADCARLAPEEIRQRITVASIVDDPVYPDNSFDLVICREVIEHLTVLQARRLVANMCRISSRFVYLTTRFHPNPTSLLDVTTQFEVDPTHITLMNKDLLRLLLVLEGFQRRADLEAQIDWMKKDRALVYEKHG
jgi:SAM-dependent methyltransferase